MAAKKRKRKNPTHAQSNPGAGLVIGLIALAVVGYGVWAVSEGISEAKKKVKKAIDEATPAPTPDRTKPAPTPDRAKPGTLTSDQVIAHVREVLERETPAGQEAMTEMVMEQVKATINDPDIKAQWPCLMAAQSVEEMGLCEPGGGGEVEVIEVDGGDENSWEPDVEGSWEHELELAIAKEWTSLSMQGKTLSKILGTDKATTIGMGENPYRYVTTIFKDMSTGAAAGKQNYLGMVAVVGYVPYGPNAHSVPVIKTKAFLNRPAGMTTTSGEHLQMQNELGHLADQTAAQWS